MISNRFAKKVEKLSGVFRQKTDTVTEIAQTGRYEIMGYTIVIIVLV